MRTILNLITSAAIPVSLALAATVAGCGSSSPGAGGQVVVVASTPQLADLAREVAGPDAEVEQILPANADPHAYEPHPSDAEALAGADLILRSGGDVDGWLEPVIEGAGAGAPVLDVLDRLPARFDPPGAGEEEPHWWQDPRAAIAAVELIRDELVANDPASAPAYRARSAAYLGELRRLDSAIAACMRRIPAAERKLVTSHDALGRYAERYGIEVIGAVIPALSTQAQASAGETAALIDTIRASGVRTIFPEAGVSRGLEESIAEQAGASVGGELWADTLGPAGSDGASYIEAEESNTAKLVDGFSSGAMSCAIDVG